MFHRVPEDDRNMESLHDGPAEETDTNHKQPAGNNAEAEEDIAKRDVQLVLSEPTIKWVEGALVRSVVLVCFVGMNLVDDFRGNGRGVQVGEMERSRGAGLPWYGNRNLEVPERWSPG
jgi:hypothetical protein